MRIAGSSASILRIAEEQSPVSRANGLLTVQLAPKQIVAALSLEFADNIRASDIEDLVRTLELEIRRLHPEVVALFVKPQTGRAFRESVHRRLGDPRETE